MVVKELETKAAFDEFLKQEKLVVIDFYADWCGPCKQIAPKISELSEMMKDEVFFGKVNVDDNDETAVACNVSAMPTFKFFKGQKEVAEVVGANYSKIEATMNEFK